MDKGDSNELQITDWFCGAGGSSQAAEKVPGLRVTRAANHWRQAIATHQANFPDVAHYTGDIRKAPVWAWPVTDLHWASPECTNWSVAKGQKRSFAKALQGDLLDLYAETEAAKFTMDDEEGTGGPTTEEAASRALMEEVPLYLRGVIERGGLVKAGIVENVIEVRKWAEWDRFVAEFHRMGYVTKLIALNSMHAAPRSVHAAPQSRDRLYLAYVHQSVGRTPDWDKWLRPSAWCPNCEQTVAALQVFRVPGADMGRYRQSYLYRCPRTTCRTVVEPAVLPASVAIDWSIPGTPIGDRTPTVDRPEGLAPATMARIRAGVAAYWPQPADLADAGQGALFADDLTAVTQPAPFVVPMRGGGDKEKARHIRQPLHTVSAGGNHHGLVTGPHHLLVPYYGNGQARTVDQPCGALTTRDRYALVSGDWDITQTRFRLLQPHEIARAMSFADDFVVLGSKKDQIRQYGNAVTPCSAEVLLCALVECVTGEDISRYAPDRQQALVAA